MKIRQLKREDWSQIVCLSDKNLGENYMTEQDLQSYFGPGRQNNSKASFVLVDNQNNVLGFRICFAPGDWPEEVLQKSLVSKWPLPPHQVAYFKTLLIDSRFQGQGWGPQLSTAAQVELEKMGALAIVCHSWKESPNNSSQRYLQKEKFKNIGEIKNFWQTKDYSCSGCHAQPCKCTAIEMIKILKEPGKCQK
ncbi:MAG: GNAT family N-acetyltransferase [Bdellovibrionales bacterium]|nr:GNAT family N-acetyltransferase [Bdellovibrionales bacterium]